MSFVRDTIRKNLGLDKDVVYHPISESFTVNYMNYKSSKYSVQNILQVTFYDFKQFYVLSHSFIKYCEQNNGKAHFVLSHADLRKINENLNDCIVEFDLSKKQNRNSIFVDGKPSRYVMVSTADGRELTVDLNCKDYNYDDQDCIFPYNMVLLENYKGEARNNSYMKKIPICDMMGNTLKEGDVVMCSPKGETLIQAALITDINANRIVYDLFGFHPGGNIVKQQLQVKRPWKLTTDRNREHLVKVGSKNHYCMIDLFKAPPEVVSKILEWKLSC